MSLGQAFDDADELLTILALFPLLFGVLVFVNNIDNPDFDAIEAFNALIQNLAQALVPSLGAILVLGVILWMVRLASDF